MNWKDRTLAWSLAASGLMLASLSAAQKPQEVPKVVDSCAGVRGIGALKPGSPSERQARECVLEVKTVLRGWNAKLPLQMDGAYDERLVRALTLFKAVYGTGGDGHSIDPATAQLLEARRLDMSGRPGESAAALKRLGRPEKSAAGEVLYGAAQYLGLPYQLNADGVDKMDCGLLTKKALFAAGIVDADFTRAADFQYQFARAQGLKRKNLIGFRAGEAKPRPGDLVFFQWTYNPTDPPPPYEGITHVGLFVAAGGLGKDDAYILAASGSAGVAIQKLSEVGKPAYSYARPRRVAPR